MFDAHRLAVQLSRKPYHRFSIGDGEWDGETLCIVDDTLGQYNDLECRFSLGPNLPQLGTLPVSVVSTVKTWQELVDDPCFDVEVPCDVSITDNVELVELTISWIGTSFDEVPKPLEASRPQNLYFEIVRRLIPSPVFLAGDIVLWGTIK